jgi:hypothetical protein
MFQRRISEEEVKQVVAMGEAIETYPTDKPFQVGSYWGGVGLVRSMWWQPMMLLPRKRSS